MNYTEFKLKFQHYPLILSRDILKSQGDPQALLNQLGRWTNKGLLIQLRKGVYIFNKSDQKLAPDINYIANRLYEPSYVSLEYALNFYGIIPEKVKDVTSITTRKTIVAVNELGRFIYQHIKPQGFRGFKKMGESLMPFFIAEPEKAVVDFLYLNLSKFGKETRDVLEHSFRFQNIEELKEQRLMELGHLFTNKKLTRILKALIVWMKEP